MRPLRGQRKGPAFHTHRGGLARVSSWARLRFAALNLKKLAPWWDCRALPYLLFSIFQPFLGWKG